MKELSITHPRARPPRLLAVMSGGLIAALSFGVVALLLALFVGVPSASTVIEPGAAKAASGYWGVPTAVHQFCEPKYASSAYFAEFYNSLSSLIYVMVAAYALTRPEIRQDAMVALSAVLVGVIGLGSIAFHGTMLFEYELCDEVPMLLFIAVALCNKIGAHPLLVGRVNALVFAAAVVAATAALTFIYIQFQVYEVFVAGFTLLVILDTVLALTWTSKQEVTNFARNLSIACIVIGKSAWEVEVRACAAYGQVWRLHVFWHILSAASLYYGLLADMAARVDCDLSPACAGVMTVPINWAMCPYPEVRVIHKGGGKVNGNSRRD